MLLREDISGEVLELSHLVVNFLSLHVNDIRAASNSLEVWTKDREELFLDDLGLFKISQYGNDVLRRVEDFLGALEVPSTHGLLFLNGAFGVVKLLLPLLENSLSLLNEGNGLLWRFLKDLGDVNLRLDLVANLNRDAVKDVFHLLLVLVNVSGDGPDQLEAIEQGGESLLNRLEVTSCDVLELALKSCQELHEVLSLGMLLREVLILLIELLN